jgi:hypothetical protein
MGLMLPHKQRVARGTRCVKASHHNASTFLQFNPLRAAEARILELKADGHGILKIGRKLGIGTSVVQRVFKQERVLS